jgi:LPS sulfotransferase NodH
MIEEAYAIACTPRVGGNWLCGLLAERGLGCPTESLHWMHLQGHCTASAMVNEWVERERNGTFGVKVSWAEADYGVDFITELLPPVPRLWLFQFRTDTLAQARSLAMARKYGNWFASTPPGAEVTADEINAAVRHIAELNAGWLAFFAQHNITPLLVPYEALVADTDGTCQRIAAALAALHPAAPT